MDLLKKEVLGLLELEKTRFVKISFWCMPFVQSTEVIKSEVTFYKCPIDEINKDFEEVEGLYKTYLKFFGKEKIHIEVIESHMFN